MIPSNIKLEHIESAIKEIDDKGIRKGRHSSTYDVIYNDTAYPPKLIVSIANRYANGEELDPSLFDGGIGTKCFNILEKNGFKIVKKMQNNNIKDAILEIIEINKIVSKNGMHLLNTLSEVKAAPYSKLIKPLRKSFTEKYGLSPNLFIKNLLEKSINDIELKKTLRIKSFGNWGRRINEYIWSTWYIENSQDQPYSNSMQLYILVNEKGIKYGFGYGDKVTDSHSQVNSLHKNFVLQGKIFEGIKNKLFSPRKYEAGSPIVPHSDNLGLINLNKNFDEWSSEIHLINSYEEKEIPDDIGEKINDAIKSLSPILKEFTNSQEIKDEKNYWLFAPGADAKDWNEFYEKGILAIDYDFPNVITEYKSYKKLKEDVESKNLGSYNTSRALWDIGYEMKIGDVVIAKKGIKEFIGYGIIESDYVYEKKDEYFHTRKVKWLKSGNWNLSEGKFPIKTLTNITEYKDLINEINNTLGIDSNMKNTISKFSLKDLLKDVFTTEKDFLKTVSLLNHKKNIILQGPPGVGKTFIAKKIAYGLMEDYDDSKIEMVQFHQSYSYEDFIQGYRPDEDSFKLVNGVFYSFCEKAKSDPDNKYFFVIDEINRGNLSKIFGELMMLIEADKRGPNNQIALTYSKKEERFYVPENVHLIGTMNTADRSLSIVDYALRRRFSFINLVPNFNDRFKAFLTEKGISKKVISSIVSKINSLNEEIENDDSLGDGFKIGHSYFCNTPKSGTNEKEWLSDVMNFEISPILNEYWFDNKDKAESLIENLNS